MAVMNENTATVPNTTNPSGTSSGGPSSSFRASYSPHPRMPAMPPVTMPAVTAWRCV